MRKYDLALNEIDKDSMFTRVFSLTWQLEDEKLYIDVIDNCQCEKEFVIYDIAFDINGRVVDNCKALYVMGDKYISEFSNAIQAEKQKRKR